MLALRCLAANMLIACTLAHTEVPPAVSAPAASYHMLEWTFESRKAYADPFNDVDVDVIFTDTALVRREDAVLRLGGVGDNYHMSWAADDRQYVSLCDGPGFTGQWPYLYSSRIFAIEGGRQNARFHDVPRYPLLAYSPAQGIEILVTTPSPRSRSMLGSTSS